MDPKEQWQEHCRQNTGVFADEGLSWAASHIEYLELKLREVTDAHDWMTKMSVREQGRAQQAEARLRNAAALLIEWGRSVTGFDPAPYQQTADWLRALPSEFRRHLPNKELTGASGSESSGPAPLLGMP